MIALNRGDVSVATPVIGLKVVFVTVFVALIVGDRMLVDYWVSAGMSAAGIALLSLGGVGGGGIGGAGRHHHVPLTVVTSLAAAACYAMFDTLVRKWSPAWGVGRLLPTAMGLAALMSCALWPAFEGRLRDLPRGAGAAGAGRAVHGTAGGVAGGDAGAVPGHDADQRRLQQPRAVERAGGVARRALVGQHRAPRRPRRVPLAARRGGADARRDRGGGGPPDRGVTHAADTGLSKPFV